MRIISALIVIVLMCVGSVYFWSSTPEVKNFVLHLFNAGKMQTLEVRHSAQTIMENNQKYLLADDAHSYLNPDLHFHPYLLMDVKYTNHHNRTGEGIILWSMVDGEMVISTSSWLKTHGFTDCIRAKADKEDFKIINILASRGNCLDREALSRILNIDNEKLDRLLENCKRKCLIVQAGNNYRLHMQNPRLSVLPETKIDQWLVTKPSKNAKRITKKYRSYQIENIAKAAFGSDFTIRRTKEIFLPVYSIVVKNPDNSEMTTHWNALNGKKLSQSYHIE
jgi:hypothetical protein